MHISEARGLVEAALGSTAWHVVDLHTIKREQKLQALAVWARRWSPLVEVDGADGLMLNIRGCEHLWGSADGLVQSLHDAMRRIGITVRSSRAPTRAMAWGVSRYGLDTLSGHRAVRDQHSNVLRMLPIEAMGFDETHLQGLIEVGITRVEDVLAMSRKALVSRFDPRVLECIDAWIGATHDPVQDAPPRERLRRGRCFDGPVEDRQAIALTIRDLVTSLAEAMESIGVGAEAIEISMPPSDRVQSWVRWTWHGTAPTRCPDLLSGILLERLDRTDVSHGVEAVYVEAVQTSPLQPRQRMAWRGVSSGEHGVRGRLVDLLRAKCGDHRVSVMGLLERHAPEQRVTLLDPVALREVHTPYQCGEDDALDRPTRLYPPLSADIQLPNQHREGHIRRGTRCSHLIAAVGPERIETPWWSCDEQVSETRDYWRVQRSDGLWLWVYCRGGSNGEWFIHGVWM